MNKKCLFLFCALFVVETQGDCAENFLKCFSEFADSFFQNISDIKHVNATEQNLPEGYKQVKDVEIKTIERITDSIQDELFKQLKQSNVNGAVIVTENPKTHIYVKTFTYNFEDTFVPPLENFSSDSDEVQSEEVDQGDFESNEQGELEQFSTEDRSTIPADTSTDINTYNGDEQTATTENNKDQINNEKSLSNDSITINITVPVEDKSAILTETNASNINNKDKVQIENSVSIITQIIDIIDKKHNKTEPIVKTNSSVSILLEKPKIHNEKSNNTSNIYIEKNATNKPPAQKILNQNLQKHNKNESITDIPVEKTSNNTDISNKNEQKTIDRSPTDTIEPTHKNLNNKQFEKDIRENLIQTDFENDYNIEDATDYPQIDYIDIYKDTTNEENDYVPTDTPKTSNIQDEIVENVEEYSLEVDTELENYTSTSICHGNTSDVSNIFPWIATIFIKNDTANNQFNYICDGALLSDKLLITAARCVNFFNSTVKPDDVLVFLGKRSLQIMGDDEKNVRISRIIVHGNFSNDKKAENDLALLVLEEPVRFTGGIRPACLGVNEELLGKSVTTAWDLSGALTPVFFEKNKNENCDVQNAGDSTFCATYGNEVALCPSYGGVYATKRAGRWYLHGIRSGDTADRGLCFAKDVLYTPLPDYQDWIMENME